VVQGPDLTPREQWLRARALGGESDLEWTFALFVFRSLALEVESGPQRIQGLDLYYESLHAWQEVIDVFGINRMLISEGLPPQWTYGVSIGMEMFESAYRARRGRLPLPALADAYRGRHSVAALGITERGELIFANSWGTAWGDGGYGYISRAYFEAHVDDVIVARPAWIGPSPQMDKALRERAWVAGRAAAPSAEDAAEAWKTPNRRTGKTISRGGQQYQVTMRRTASARSGTSPVEMIDLRDSSGRILGRTHIRHHRKDRSTIEELFVAPEFRRLGYGTILASMAVERVVGWKKRKVQLLLHEADATSNGQARAIAFGSACGFAWTGRSSRRPNIVDIAERSLDNGERNT
jgi:GNAT superfamily N-acetyltransferase